MTVFSGQSALPCARMTDRDHKPRISCPSVLAVPGRSDIPRGRRGREEGPGRGREGQGPNPGLKDPGGLRRGAATDETVYRSDFVRYARAWATRKLPGLGVART